MRQHLTLFPCSCLCRGRHGLPGLGTRLCAVCCLLPAQGSVTYTYINNLLTMFVMNISMHCRDSFYLGFCIITKYMYQINPKWNAMNKNIRIDPSTKLFLTQMGRGIQILVTLPTRTLYYQTLQQCSYGRCYGDKTAYANIWPVLIMTCETLKTSLFD